MLHPAIRVLLVLALAAALPRLPLLDLAVIAAVLLGMLAALGRDALLRWVRGLLRVKWLLLAIAVLYWGFTPGEPLHPALPGLSREGLAEGVRRMLALAALLAAVYGLMLSTSVADLAAALGTLLVPLTLLGINPRRVALLLALTLDEVSRGGAVLARARARHPDAMLDAAAQALGEIERRSAEGSAEFALPRPAPPPVWQWLLPLALAVLLHRLGQ